MKNKCGFDPCDRCDMGGRHHGPSDDGHTLSFRQRVRLRKLEEAIPLIRQLRRIELDDSTFVTPVPWKNEMKSRLDAMMFEYQRQHQAILKRAGLL